MIMGRLMTMNRKILNDNDIERIRKNVSVINHDELVKICFEMITKNLDADEVDLVVDMLWDYSTDLFFKSKYREFIDFSIPFKKLTEKGTSIFCKSVELDVAGIICYLTEDDDKAAELMNDLYIHSVKHGLKVSEIKSQLNLTGWYLDHNRLDDALVSLQRVEGMDGNTLFTKSFLYNMYYLFKARINIVQMELQEFNENIEKLDMSSNARFPDNIIFEMYELRAKYCVLNNDYTGAFAMYTKAIEFAEERNIKKEVLKVYKDISNLYLENKQFEKSILYLNKYIELSADLNESHRKLASQKAELETEMAVLKAKNELIKSQRDSDYLTGLFNRGYFTEFLEQRFAQYCNAGETFSLMIIDL